jgi:hypothetical protein
MTAAAISCTRGLKAPEDKTATELAAGKRSESCFCNRREIAAYGMAPANVFGL